MGIAKVLSSTGKATKAVDIYHRVIRILELNRGVETEDLVVPLFGLGSLLIKEGKVTGAENSFIRLVRIPFILIQLWVFRSFFTFYSSFFRILNIYTKLYGKNDGRVGLAMCSLAHAKCAKGSFYNSTLHSLSHFQSLNVLQYFESLIASMVHCATFLFRECK